MKNLRLFLFILVTAAGCGKKEGCTDHNASNFNGEAEKDDGSCVFPRNDITGDYNCDFTWDASHHSAPTLQIINSSVNTGEVILIFDGSPLNGDSIMAQVTPNVISINNQTIYNRGGADYTITGTGGYSSGSINLTLTQVITGTSYPINVSGIKQ